LKQTAVQSSNALYLAKNVFMALGLLLLVALAGLVYLSVAAWRNAADMAPPGYGDRPAVPARAMPLTTDGGASKEQDAHKARQDLSANEVAGRAEPLRRVESAPAVSGEADERLVPRSVQERQPHQISVAPAAPGAARHDLRRAAGASVTAAGSRSDDGNAAANGGADAAAMTARQCRTLGAYLADLNERRQRLGEPVPDWVESERALAIARRLELGCT
jgi:hypothetical protein